jgi:hypothetical protein
MSMADEGVQLRPVLSPDLDHVFKARVGHQHDPCTVALEK